MSDTTKDTIASRLSDLREVMRRERLAAFIFPSTDPHCGEYVPDRWKGREFISGFDGSAGTAVVTMSEAALWTDSRYFLAAGEQLAGTEFVLMKERVEGTPTIAEWLGRKLAVSDTTEVGIDGMTCPAADVDTLRAGLRANGGLTLRTNFDPLALIWKDRPEAPLAPVELHPVEYAGEDCPSKLARVRAAMRERHAEGMLVSSLDDIAWTLNLRGTDVHCNPVFVSYLLVTHVSAVLFVDSRKITDGVAAYLETCGVELREYGDITSALRAYGEYNILMDGSLTSHTLYNSVRTHGRIDTALPITAMKAVKNAVEADGFRRAMVRDGVAMVKFLCRLRAEVERGGLTELGVCRLLAGYRSAQPLFRDLSFDTIAAYGAHGAVVHYEPTEGTDTPLEPRGLLLIDSGAHYLDGTTDITRTVALGPVDDEQRRVYTLVLKGHIALSMLKFPHGAAGTQLDAVARAAMWREGMNFMHGTGHGVGSYLNVHEGPHQIRMEWRPAPLLPGMTVTDEPGIYIAGRFGVRIENTLIVVPYMETGFGRFLQFEPLTLCPIDTAPIIPEMLTDEEKRWLDDYHARVFGTLSPLLEAEEADWLRRATSPIG